MDPKANTASAVHAITIVTVTRNNLAGLQRTFTSLATQAFRDVQHVVIDGASTDGSREWLEKARVFDATLIVSEPDEGVYDAMNKGARLADGVLLNFLNAGDAYADPQVLVRVMASYGLERWDWGYGLARTVGPDEAPIRPVRRARYSKRRHALGMISVPHQATFMRTEFFRQLGEFETRFTLAGDTELLLRAAIRSTPARWDSVDVLSLAGGMSDAGVFANVYERHLVRASLTGVALRPWPADLIWTLLHAATIGTRKAAKRTLNAATGGRFTRWWAARGL